MIGSLPLKVNVKTNICLFSITVDAYDIDCSCCCSCSCDGNNTVNHNDNDVTKIDNDDRISNVPMASSIKLPSNPAKLPSKTAKLTSNSTNIPSKPAEVLTAEEQAIRELTF